jgi:hypothetical protein
MEADTVAGVGESSGSWIEAEAEALAEDQQRTRDSENRARAQLELEAALIAQEQVLERGTGVPLPEQEYVDPDREWHRDEGIVSAGGSVERSGLHESGEERDATLGGIPLAGQDHTAAWEPLLVDGERTFEGVGRHSLRELGASRHALERSRSR